MMDKKVFTPLTSIASKIIALKNSCLEFGAKIKTVRLARSSVIPSWVTFSTHLLRGHFTPDSTFRSIQKNISPALPILCHTFSGAVFPASRSYKKLSANRAGLINKTRKPIFIHGISKAVESTLTSFTRSYFLSSFRCAMAWVFSPISKVTLISTELTQMPLIWLSTIKAESLKYRCFRLAFHRAVFTGRCYRDTYSKGLATLAAIFYNLTTFPMGVKTSGSSFTPLLIASPTAKMMVTPRLPRRSLELSTTSITKNLYHTYNNIINYEVSQ